MDVVVHHVPVDRVQVAGRHRGPEPDRTTVGRAAVPGGTGGKEQHRAEQSLVEQLELGAAADSTSAAGNDERRSSRDKETASTPQYFFVGLGRFVGSNGRNGSSRSGCGWELSLHRRALKSLDRRPVVHSHSLGLRRAPPPPFAFRGRPILPPPKKQIKVLVLATYGIAAPIRSNRDAPHSPLARISGFTVCT